MFINNFVPSSSKKLGQLLETLRVTYDFDLDNRDPQHLAELAQEYEAIKQEIVAESQHNSYHTNPDYARAVLITEAIKLLIEVAPKRKKRSVKEGQSSETDSSLIDSDTTENANIVENPMTKKLSLENLGSDQSIKDFIPDANTVSRVNEQMSPEIRQRNVTKVLKKLNGISGFRSHWKDQPDMPEKIANFIVDKMANGFSFQDALVMSHKQVTEAKKPDADGDGIPDWADKHPFKAGGKEDRKLKESVGSDPYTYQASMARSELYRNAKYAMSMLHQIQVEDEIQPWIAGALTKAAGYLDKIFHYLDYYKTFEPQVLPEEMDSDMELGETSGSVARQNLLMIVEYSTKLFDMIQPGDHLEGWVAMKLTTASECISSSKHYMDYVHFEKHALDDHFDEGRRSIRRAVAESMLLEDENLEHAETLLAAKDISDRLQKMAEDAAKMAVDDLMPLVDTMKEQFGLDQANAFNEVVKGTLQTVLDSVIAAKDQTDNAILTIQGGGTPSMATDIAQNAGVEPAMAAEPGAEGGDMDFDNEFVATPATSGPKEEPLGRAKKGEEGLAEGDTWAKGNVSGKSYPVKSVNDWEGLSAFHKAAAENASSKAQKFYHNSLASTYDKMSKDEALSEGAKKGRIPPQFLTNIKKRKAQAGKKVTEARKKCMECDTGMYEEDSKGRMKCNKCGAMMVTESSAPTLMSPAATAHLKKHGFFYSGDKSSRGLNYSNDDGDSYDIWHNEWHNNSSGKSGSDFESLDADLRANQPGVMESFMRGDRVKHKTQKLGVGTVVADPEDNEYPVKFDNDPEVYYTPAEDLELISEGVMKSVGRSMSGWPSSAVAGEGAPKDVVARVKKMDDAMLQRLATDKSAAPGSPAGLQKKAAQQELRRRGQSISEAQSDYAKRRQRERDVEAGKPVKPLPKNPKTDYEKKRAEQKKQETGKLSEDLGLASMAAPVLGGAAAALGTKAWDKLQDMRRKKKLAQQAKTDDQSQKDDETKVTEASKKCMECRTGMYMETNNGKMKCNKCGHTMVAEAWDTKMKTAKKDLGKWEGWTIAELKSRKKKLMDKEERSAAEQKEVRQINFAIRAKQEDHWGKIKEEDAVNEAWGTKMKTAKKDISKWEGYTVAELKARKKKLMDKEERSAAEQKEVRQINFAIRAKKEDKWGKIDEADSGESQQFVTVRDQSGKLTRISRAMLNTVQGLTSRSGEPQRFTIVRDENGKSEDPQRFAIVRDETGKMVRVNLPLGSTSTVDKPTYGSSTSAAAADVRDIKYPGGSYSVDEDVIAPGAKPSANDLSTQQLNDLKQNKPIKDETGKPIAGITQQDATKVLASRAKGLQEKAVSKAQQMAAGAALAAKRGDIPKSELKGASKEMIKMSTKELEKFAGTPRKGLPKKVESAVTEGIDRKIQGLTEQYNTLHQEFLLHKEEFSKQLKEGTHTDPLMMGYGLQGDVILSKMKEVKQLFQEAQREKAQVIATIENKKVVMQETQQKINKFSSQLNSQPYGVVGLDSNNKKVQKFFESQESRSMWMEFNKTTLTDLTTIDPQHIQNAAQYLKTKIRR